MLRKMMLSRKTICIRARVMGLALVVFGATTTLAQSTTAPSSSLGLEFPVTLRQNVEAGKTPIGTKVQAKLTVATLVNGVVIPENAILSGEVIESVAKSATEPSRLGIRMDSARWKNEYAPTVLALKPNVYLTAWYYPTVLPSPRDPSDSSVADASQSGSLSRGGAPPYPGPSTTNSRRSRRTPPDDVDPEPTPPAKPGDLTQHRVPIKNVESARTGEGSLTLISKRANIKLDKSTTYVLSSDDLGTGPGARSPNP